MDYTLERKYHVERLMDFVRALEEQPTDVQETDDERVFFVVSGRPFEVLVWVDEDHDMICITTRTVDFPVTQFEDAVKMLQASMQICWEHCVAVSPVENRYDLSMALFLGGFSFDAFEAVVYNLISCASAIEEQYKKKK